MAILPIITIPDPLLRKKAASVERVDAALLKLAENMLATMYDAPGIGLAAPQVGILRRLIVMDPSRDEEAKQPLVMINPVILERGSEMRTHEEGCLSIPEYYEEVERPARVRVRFTDLDGKVHEEDADGLFATCIQHEIDHLNGVLFVDYLSKLKRDRVLKKFAKAAKRAAE